MGYWGEGGRGVGRERGRRKRGNYEVTLVTATATTPVCFMMLLTKYSRQDPTTGIHFPELTPPGACETSQIQGREVGGMTTFLCRKIHKACEARGDHHAPSPPQGQT